MPGSAFERTPEYDPNRFASPPAIDRGAPFWAWNGRLVADRLHHQLEVFARMGLGGAHMHPRTGLATAYMSEEFLTLVRSCVDKAEQLGLHAWLYDEDRWPSGFAGGLATADEKYQTRYLRLTARRIAPGESRGAPTHHGEALALTRRTFVAAWALRFEDGFLISSRLIGSDEGATSGERGLYAYLEIPPAWSWFNNTQYVDSLNPAAMRRFLEVTHESYRDAVGDRFGSVVPAIFTDEPLFWNMEPPPSPEMSSDSFLSWTDDLPETYEAAYGEDLLDVLPDVLFDRPDGSHRRARWRFHNHHTDRFVDAFASQLGQWCAASGILLTGHMMEESSLAGQTRWTGEAMRSLRHFQLPGIDMLCDRLEFTTAKQAQSVARQTGAPGVLSELYGVTNWDFPFSGHKRQGDWQAALGVVTRVHHLTWYQMGGEAKRDYPASIGEHSPWWRRYRVIEDHFARLNAALRSGVPLCRIAMIHPIESHWLVHGPAACERERQRLEDGFAVTLSWMLEDLLDVDLVSEAVLEDLPARHGPADTDGFQVGEMTYDVVVVPPVTTLRRNTLTRLGTFAAAGGKVVMLDAGPELIDAEFPVREEDVNLFTQVSWQQGALLSELEEFREARLLDASGVPAHGVTHQLRRLPDGGRILFVCRFNDSPQYDLAGAVLEVRGDWNVVCLNTDAGTESPRAAESRSGWTRIPIDLPIAGHVLLRLDPGRPVESIPVVLSYREAARLPEPSSISLLEENALPLDIGEWRLDDGQWQPADEILRIDNLARGLLGQTPRHGNIAQPWVEDPAPHEHTVTVAFSLTVREGPHDMRLALEDAGTASVSLDGLSVPVVPDGEWMDIAFTAVRLPALAAGTHRLEITWPFGGGGGLEACYLIGDFGVEVRGAHATITGPVRNLVWGDATRQGLAFYGGTLRYTVRTTLPCATARRLVIAHSAGALVDVSWQGSDPVPVYRDPWSIDLPDELSGQIEFTIDCYGTRINTFGQIHNAAKGRVWGDPRSWRTGGDEWAYEYQLKPVGILSAPRIVCGTGTHTNPSGAGQ